MAVTKQETQADAPVQIRKKSAAREWLDSIVFAVVAATLIRWLFMEAFTIPTPSMEKSLLVGDFLFVSKLHYGTRTTTTPLQIPLTHQTIWGTNIPSYSRAIQLPTYRLPGFTHVKAGDVVVFNYPGDPEDPNEPVSYGGWQYHPVDLRTNYIKRCIGLPGQMLQVRDAQVYIDGKLSEQTPRMQFYYNLVATEQLNERAFKRFDVQSFEEATPDSTQKAGTFTYRLLATPESVEKIKTASFVRSIKQFSPYTAAAVEPQIYPTVAHWNPDFYGPVQIPKQGLTIPMDSAHVALYVGQITHFEGYDPKQITVSNNQLSIDGKVQTSYTFKQDYYFMMGDNRYNSADSRFWGFVPADHVVGKAVFVWMSIDPNPDSFWQKIRWNRLFRVIE
jgi:signal peptidase I